MDPKTWRHCQYCGQDSVFMWNQQRRKDGSKVYTNESGARWAGRRCPECERSRVNSSVRCTPFEMDLVRSQLEQGGYKILSKSVPLLVEKDGLEQKVGIRRVRVTEGQLVFDQHDLRPADFYVLLFAEVRLCPSDKLARMMQGSTSRSHHKTESIGESRVP
ncbi:MAG: hypothetical protein AB8C84_01870 [Oligoflexales bacterium]